MHIAPDLPALHSGFPSVFHRVNIESRFKTKNAALRQHFTLVLCGIVCVIKRYNQRSGCCPDSMVQRKYRPAGHKRVETMIVASNFLLHEMIDFTQSK
jgi:hypothetical protein